MDDAVVVGDSVWDMLAARRARALGIGLLSGGYGTDELERAGAYRVYDDPADLLDTWTRSGSGPSAWSRAERRASRPCASCSSRRNATR